MVNASDWTRVRAASSKEFAAARSEVDRQFADLLDRREIRTLFEPLVDLMSGQVVALEARPCGPEHGPLASARSLFAAARRAGRVAELDWTCRAVAFETFLEAGVPPSVSLLVDMTPESIGQDCPADLVRTIARAESRLRVFVELTGRALSADPAGALAAADHAREMGWGIVVGGVGASPSPIAMLPIVAPDAVQIDLRRLGETERGAAAAIVSGVLRHTARTGAALLVKGVQTRNDAAWARALGASCGLGRYLGAPGPLQETYPLPRTPIPLIKVAPTDLHVASPFELFEGAPMVKVDRTHLDDLAGMLASVPRTSGCPSVFLVCLGASDQLPPAVVETGIPEGAMVFVAFGTDMPPEPARGVRGVRLPPGDAFAGELFLIVLSDQAPAAAFARAASPDFYDAVVTHDFELVHEIARHIIRRVPVLGQDNTALGGTADEEVPPAQQEEEVAPELPHRRGWRGWRST
ncbi:MAG: EAL domain-containing protein [Cellulomonas sp.]|nr:EAL domain-containing protein [Cellulomonas sp.]